MDAFLHTLVYNPNLTLPNPPSTSPDPNLYRKFIPGGRPFGPFCTIPWSNANTTDQHDCVRCALPARECALQRLHHEEVRVLTSARGPASVTTAYLLGLISSAGPRIARVLLLLATGKLTLRAARLQLATVLKQALSIHRFPAFCAALVGGSTFLQLPINRLCIAFARLFASTIDPRCSPPARLLVKFLAALSAASVAFKLINGAPHSSLSVDSASLQLHSHLDTARLGPFDEPPENGSGSVDDATLGALSLAREDLSGRTLDLTLFAVVRALDVVISSTWNRIPAKTTSRLRRLSQATPPLLFYFSAATIMHAWFYSPSRLPQAYNAWIAAAAGLDHRLLLALRHARYGTWVYGKDTGMAPLLGSLCRDYGLQEELGDPAVTIPLPCEVVHMGCSKSCEKHALNRFWRGWLFAAKMYGPLQLFVVLRHAWKKARPGAQLAGLTRPVLLQATEDVARSSAFLGAFVALVHYGVCLSRTRLGPKLFSYRKVTPQMWDSGLCVLGGCLLCGTSIFVEQSRKRLEILFFLLPRAAATWFPRRYLPEHRWKEHLAFTLSAAVLITTAQHNPKRVHGVFGKVLHGVLETD